MNLTKRVIQMLGVALLLGVSEFPAAQAAQGLYSMKALVGAPVFTSDREKAVGDVDNVLVNEQMKVVGLVVEIDDDIGNLDGKKLFVKSGRFRLVTQNGGQVDSVRYQVYLHVRAAELTQFPVVDNGWWQTTKQAATQVWEKTKSTASSVWDATKDATSKALDATGNAAKDVIDTIRDKTR